MTTLLPYGPVSDGSAVLDHSAFDRSAWSTAQEINPGLVASLEKRSRELPTVSAFTRDIFWSMYQWRPKLAPPAPLRPSHRVHQQLLEQMIATSEWQELRGKGTQHDPLMASVATVGMAQQVLGSLPEEDKNAIRQAADQEEMIERLSNQADAHEQVAAGLGEGQENRQARLMRAAELKRKQAAKLQQAQADQPVEISEEGMDKARQAFRKAAQQASETAGDLAESTYAFGIGAERGLGTARSEEEIRQTMAVAEQLQKNSFLRMVAEKAGRKIRVALSMQETRLDATPELVLGIKTSGDIQRALPSDLALLANPATAPLFFAKMADQALLTYDLSGQTKCGRGPVIVALDESGSMNGQPLAWAKAIILALIAVAKTQDRPVRVIAFASRGELEVWDFLPGTSGSITPTRLLEMTAHNFRGGTDFEGWMDAALTAVEASTYDKADCICITDGIADPSPETLKRWNTVRAERGMRCLGIDVSRGAGMDAVFKSMCDEHTDLSKDLQNESAADSLLFNL